MADQRRDYGDYDDPPTAEDATAPEAEAEANPCPGIDDPAPIPWTERLRFPPLDIWVPRTVMLLGGVATGKSALLAAMKQSSDLCLGRRVRIDVKPSEGWRPLDLGDEDDRSSRYEGTTDCQDHRFDVSGYVPTSAWRRASHFNTKLVCHDTPGGMTPWLDALPSRVHPSIRKTVLDQTKRAQALIICLDGTRCCADWFARSMMPLLVAALDRTAKPYPRLSAGRILVLFNKMDQAVTETVAGHPNRNSLNVTDDTDLLRFARERIGDANLNALYKLKAPNAKLAIGLSSAFGFDERGEALVDGDGVPNRFDDDLGRNGFIQRWRPYGVLEAFLFLATGRSTSGTLMSFEPELLLRS
jgi:hypothetical protein